MAARACPICSKPVTREAPQRPFCSPRCKNIDLGNWLGEAYRIHRPMNPLEAVQTVDEMVGDFDDDPSKYH